MRRLGSGWEWLTRCAARAGRAVTAVVGLEETLLVVALALLTAGAWPVVGRVALTIPGAVLLWLTLPARAPFVTRPMAPNESERQVR